MKKWAIPLIMGFVLCGFFVREMSVSSNQTPLFLAEEQLVLLAVGEGSVFGMGRIDSPKAKSLSQELLPFLSSKEIIDIWGVPLGQEQKDASFSLQRISSNLVRTLSQGKAAWWIGEEFSSDEQTVAVHSGVSFDADWWIMTRNTLPEFLPLPTQGIVFAGDRVPSQKTITFAQEKKLPLIIVKEAGGISLALLPSGEWELRTREAQK